MLLGTRDLAAYRALESVTQMCVMRMNMDGYIERCACVSVRVCVCVATVKRSARQAFNSGQAGRQAGAAWALATKRSEELEPLLLPTANCLQCLQKV